MKLLLKVLISLAAFNVSQVHATLLQQGQFTYKGASDWERVIGLSKSGFILKNDVSIMTFESWGMRDLLADHDQYIESLAKEKELYNVDEFISCALHVHCKDDSLKKYLSNSMSDESKSEKLIDVCSNENLHCIIFDTNIDEYTFEAFVYSNSNNRYFIRILTNLKSKSKLLKHLNNIELNSQ